jgi:hypothetical protein
MKRLMITALMSAFAGSSAIPTIADVKGAGSHVREVPIPDSCTAAYLPA